MSINKTQNNKTLFNDKKYRKAFQDVATTSNLLEQRVKEKCQSNEACLRMKKERSSFSLRCKPIESKKTTAKSNLFHF